MNAVNKEQVLETLRHVYDPDHPEKSLVDLGVVDDKGIEVGGNAVQITYCMRAPLCPYSAAIGVLIRRALQERFGAEVKVRIDLSHYQAGAVNDVLDDEAKSRELAGKMEASGLFKQCIRGL